MPNETIAASLVVPASTGDAPPLAHFTTQSAPATLGAGWLGVDPAREWGRGNGMWQRAASVHDVTGVLSVPHNPYAVISDVNRAQQQARVEDGTAKLSRAQYLWLRAFIRGQVEAVTKQYGMPADTICAGAAIMSYLRPLADALRYEDGIENLMPMIGQAHACIVIPLAILQRPIPTDAELSVEEDQSVAQRRLTLRPTVAP